MTPSEPAFPAKEKTEYEISLTQFRHFASLRRQDMAFATTVQGAVLAIVKDHIVSLGPADFLLTLLAFLVLLMGLNNERRLSSYMCGYMDRARQIEDQFGMKVLHIAFDWVQRERLLVSNRKTFPLYYLIFATLWLTIWTLNLVK